MSYEKHIWKKGDKITAERLNIIEEGIANNETSSSNGGNSSNEKIILLDMTLTDTDPVTYSYDNLQVPFTVEEFNEISPLNMKMIASIFIPDENDISQTEKLYEAILRPAMIAYNGESKSILFTSSFIVEASQMLQIELYIYNNEFTVIPQQETLT